MKAIQPVMAIFLIIYFGLYGGINFICYRALAPLISPTWLRALLAVMITLLVLSPLAIRRFEAWGLITGARVLTFIAWHWMALAFWLALMAAPLLAWNALAAWRTQAGASLAFIPHRPAMAVTLSLVVLLLIWGVAEAQAIHLRRVRLIAPAGSGLINPLRFVFISDVHLSLIRGDRLALKIKTLINQAQPEFVLSGGDLLDGQALHLERSAARLGEATAPLGKFGVLGNHEWYSGLPEALATHAAAGITLLRGAQVDVRPDVLVVGHDDITGKAQAAAYHGPEEIPAFKTPPALRAYTIYLSHQPLPPQLADGKFDLMLSGHTHGGQIFPFGWVVRLRYRYLRGLYSLPGGGMLYVTPGTGTWGPSLRVLARPEVTLFEIMPPSGSPA